MQYRSLGPTGLKVSELGLGSWITFSNITDNPGDAVYELMREAYDLGVNFFDTAEAYADGGAEELMGIALKRGGWRRETLVIATKLFWGRKAGLPYTVNEVGLSRKHVVEGMRASLQRLQLDYVDIVYAHRPDPHTPMEEVVRAFNFLIDHGLAFYWGTSEWSPREIAEAMHIARRLNLIAPVVEQPEYNMFARNKVERDYSPFYVAPYAGLGLTTWSPLKFGILTGKYGIGGTIPADSRGALASSLSSSQKPSGSLLRSAQRVTQIIASDEGSSMLARVEDLRAVAVDHNCTLSQLALAWCLKNQRVSSVIMGASRPSQIRENVASLRCVEELDSFQMARIAAILDNDPTPEVDARGR